MTPQHDNTPPDRAADLDAARLLLTRMGITAHDLINQPLPRTPLPTFAEYIPIVSDAVSEGTRRVYTSYWNRINEHWGHRRLDEPTPSQIKHLVEHVRTNVVTRRNARGGRSAGEHLIAALRCLYRHAEDDRLITPADNPARKVPKPPRLPSTRRAVANDRLAEINHTAATTGNDPALDTLLLRLHTETACRRGGALALRPQDLDPAQCLIFLREKGETVRWQPVSPTLMAHLQQHANDRHAPHTGQLLRYHTGQPITRRRYDHLWTRLGTHLPWVATQQISTHWLRHTTLTWVERNFGYAIARAYAGHNDPGFPRSPEPPHRGVLLDRPARHGGRLRPRWRPHDPWCQQTGDLRCGATRFGEGIKGESKVSFSASTTIRRSDFGITFDARLGNGRLIVGEDVRLLLEIEAVLREDPTG